MFALISYGSSPSFSTTITASLTSRNLPFFFTLQVSDSIPITAHWGG